MNINITSKMYEWYKQPLGNSLLQVEKNYYDAVISKVFGYYLLQMGGCYSKEFYTNNPIPNRIVVSQDFSQFIDANKNVHSVIAEFEELPFLCDSVDVAAIFHVLEFTKNPRLVLEEVYHTLVPQGKIIIFGFNSRSLWGMWRVFRDHVNVPWQGRFISSSRMRNWLTKLGFSIVNYQTFYFRPPVKKAKTLNKLLFMEKIGKFCWPGCGGVYMLVAEKRIVPLTPVQERASLLKHKLSEGIV